MAIDPPYERLPDLRAQAPRFTESQLAVVEDVQDENGLARVQIRLLSYDGPELHDGPIWARVAVPVAGAKRGTYLVPNVGDEVLVTFIGGDPRMPVVIGSLWNGEDKPTMTHGDSRGVDRWGFRTQDGTEVTIVEEQVGQSVMTLSLPNGGVKAELKQASGGQLKLTCGGATVTLTPGGVSIQGGSIEIRGTSIKMNAGTVKVETAIAEFTGVVKAVTVQADSIVGTTYTPGAGNIW